MVWERLERVIRKTLGLAPSVGFTRDNLASDVPGWDSLSHVRVLTAVEEEFSIRFASREVMRLRNIGALHDLVEQKVGKS